MSTMFSIIILTTLQIVKSADEWIPFPNTDIQYMYVTQCRPWQESIVHCQDIGGELASASTIAKRDFLVNTVYDGTTPIGADCSSWIGTFCGAVHNQLNNIFWFDGTQTRFVETGNLIDWDVDEPDGVLKYQPSVGFKLATRKWHSVNTFDYNPQICQRIVTTIFCEHWYECSNKRSTCTPGGICSIYCTGKYSCKGKAVLDGGAATTLSVECTNIFSCVGAHFICPINGGMCVITCSGYKSCKYATCDGECTFIFLETQNILPMGFNTTQSQEKSDVAKKINYALIITVIYLIMI